MRKFLVAWLTSLLVLTASAFALAGGKIAVSYTADDLAYYEITTPVGPGKDTAIHVKYFNVDGAYSFSKELSATAFFKKGDLKDVSYTKVGQRTLFGSELTYNFSKDLTLGGFFDYRLDTDNITGTDKSGRLRYGLRGKYASGKYTVISYIRNTSFEFDDAYAEKNIPSSVIRERNAALESPIKFEIEGDYNLLNSKETGRVDALLVYAYENAAIDDYQRKTAGFGLGIRGTCQLEKLTATYRLAYSPLTYTQKDAGVAKKYDRNEFKLSFAAEYPISDKYFVKATYDLLRAKFEKESNDNYRYSEDSVYVGGGVKF